MALFYVSVICLYQMKKTLMLIIMLLLAACTAGTPEKVENQISELTGTDEVEIGSFLAENYGGDDAFSVGTGISTLDLNDAETISLYPVYVNDRLAALAVKDKTFKYITDDDLLNCFEDHDEYLIVNEGSNIVYVAKDKTVLLHGEAGYLEEKETEEMLKKIRSTISSPNPLGKERKALVVNKSKDDTTKDGRYRNDRIIVSFKEGDTVKMIEDFEQFCGGKAQSGVNTSNIYIFVFEPLSDKDLYALLEESRSLEYVSGVSLDQKHETNGNSGNKATY